MYRVLFWLLFLIVPSLTFLIFANRRSCRFCMSFRFYLRTCYTPPWWYTVVSTLCIFILGFVRLSLFHCSSHGELRFLSHTSLIALFTALDCLKRTSPSSTSTILRTAWHAPTSIFMVISWGFVIRLSFLITAVAALVTNKICHATVWSEVGDESLVSCAFIQLVYTVFMTGWVPYLRRSC